MDERLSQAIVLQGTSLQKRVEFIQKMLERNTQAIEKAQNAIEIAQKMIGLLRVDLLAANLALDAIRDEYRNLLKEDAPKPDTEE